MQLTSVPLAPSVRSVRARTSISRRSVSSSSLVSRGPSRPRLNARSSDADDPPPHPRSFSSQKLQRAGFVSVRDVKKTRGPVELAQGASASPLLALLPPRFGSRRAPPRSRGPNRSHVGALSSDVPDPDRRIRRRPPPSSTTRAEAGLTNEEASEVMKVVRFGVDGAALAGAKSASGAAARGERRSSPSTRSATELDDAARRRRRGRARSPSCAGAPGIGKTQMCVQLCASRRRSRARFGGPATARRCTWTRRGRSRRSARRTSRRRRRSHLAVGVERADREDAADGGRDGVVHGGARCWSACTCSGATR